MATLPVEIWEQILDCLKYDSDALMNCLLVCRVFNRKSKEYLPTVIYLDGRKEIAQAAMQRGRWKGPREVSIRGSEVEERKPIPHLGAFAMMARKWTRVRKLEIWHAEWRAADVHLHIFLDLSLWDSITHLALGNIVFPTVSTFGHLICALANLRRLQCGGLAFSEHHFDIGTFRKRTPSMKLSRLDLYDSSSLIDIVNFFAVTEAGANINTLLLGDDWNCAGVENIQDLGIQHLLQVTGTSLHELQLGVILAPEQRPSVRGSGIEYQETYLDFGHNPGIKKLHLMCQVKAEDADFGWVARSLSRITSHGVLWVDLYFNLQTIHSSRQINAIMTRLHHDCLSRIDAVFSLPAFVRLEKVHFELWISKTCRHVIDHTTWLEITASALPLLERRGILSATVL